MATSTKALMIGALGGVATIGYALSQAKSSLSVREQLGLDGYILISEKEAIAEKIWKERVELYKKADSNLLLGKLSKDDDKEKDWNKLKEECSKYTEKNVLKNSLKEVTYEKLTKLCALNIKEYIEVHLKNKDDEEKIIQKSEKELWKANFKKYQEEITKEISGITEDNADSKLNEFCEAAYKLQKSNENIEKLSQAKKWCVNRKEKNKPPKPEAPENK